ncbi:MAG: tetratricopeptide repeat protein [Melioribacteraceae bacterium]|nr:tetratricopeptide repeat protein [Melioribacteraceae bacterium]MCF8264734.1 tetratricopeptide repeat protein [Melioribacteraceae bacterium]MCF8413174.1 tetratricopeptide repeat protein [Melioribacteraceae bacterium]
MKHNVYMDVISDYIYWSIQENYKFGKKMRIRYLIGLIIISALVTSCGSKSEEEFLESAKLKADQGEYVEALAEYEEMLEEYPESDSNPKIYFEIGKIYHSNLIKSLTENESLQKAIEYYQKVYSDYTKSPEAPNALFMVGFIQANELKQLDAARETYNTFLESFPDSELADDAQAELDNLGLEPEQILLQKIKKAN